MARGAPFIVADMPFGSFQVSNDAALENAVRFVKEAGADAVKLEGAGPTLARVAALVDAGIPVMGHIGLTPQSATMLGGYKAQGRTAADGQQAAGSGDRARVGRLFRAGARGDSRPGRRAHHGRFGFPRSASAPGVDCDGQVLVWHDLLGLTSGHVARFVKQYADIGGAVLTALTAYVADVRSSGFPEKQHTYAMADEEALLFQAEKTTASSGARTRD